MGDESGDAGNGACTGFATGSLSTDAKVPGEVPTALGVTLDLQSVAAGSLQMAFLCTSNGAVIQEGPVLEGGDVDGGASIDFEAEGQPYNISFEWVVGDDIDFSVAVDEI